MAPSIATLAAFSSSADLINTCQNLLDQKLYKESRLTMTQYYSICETDEKRLKLHDIWVQSLYEEFLDARFSACPELDRNDPNMRSKLLSNSMRYKLRKKSPCPVELDQELKVKNARLPNNVHLVLNAWLKEHKENPYPNKIEKETLSCKLGITPQQVNRWFIQRRKMIRLRGLDYLGRCETKDPSSEDFEEEDEEPVFESRTILGTENNLHSASKLTVNPKDMEAESTKLMISEVKKSMLENILTVPQKNDTLPHCASLGSVVPIVDPRVIPIQKFLIINDQGQEIKQETFALPTPPASIYGDSITKCIPADSSTEAPKLLSDQNEALDLTTIRPDLGVEPLVKISVPTPKSSPIILEPLSPHWKNGEEKVSHVDNCLNDIELMAVDALVTLSHSRIKV